MITTTLRKPICETRTAQTSTRKKLITDIGRIYVFILTRKKHILSYKHRVFHVCNIQYISGSATWWTCESVVSMIRYHSVSDTTVLLHGTIMLIYPSFKRQIPFFISKLPVNIGSSNTWWKTWHSIYDRWRRQGRRWNRRSFEVNVGFGHCARSKFPMTSGINKYRMISLSLFIYPYWKVKSWRYCKLNSTQLSLSILSFVLSIYVEVLRLKMCSKVLTNSIPKFG